MNDYNVVFILKSARETMELGRALGALFSRGDVLALIGDLGSGKTTFTQGVAGGLGVDEEYYVTSPSFTIINEYPARCTLYHVDLYRLSSETSLDELGLEEYLESEGVTVIEWADKLPIGSLPDCGVCLRFEFMGADKRRITVTPIGAEGQSRLRTWLQDEVLKPFLENTVS